MSNKIGVIGELRDLLIRMKALGLARVLDDIIIQAERAEKAEAELEQVKKERNNLILELSKYKSNTMEEWLEHLSK